MNKIKEKIIRDQIVRSEGRLYLKGVKYSNPVPLANVRTKNYPLINYKKLKPGEKVSCASDKAFKMLIMNSKDPRMLAKLISVFYKVEYEEVYKNLTIDKTEHDKEGLRVPVRISDGLVGIRGNRTIIENNRIENEERNIHYLDMIYGSSITYKNRRQYLSSAGIINFNQYWYEGHEESIEVYMMKNEREELLTFCKQIVNVYVPIIERKWYDREELDERERYTLIVFTTDSQVARELGKGDEVYMDFIERSERIAENEEFIVDYYGEFEGKEDYFDFGKRVGTAEGHEKGREEGREEGQSEIIRKMYKQGLTVESIAKYVEMSVKKVQSILGLF